MYAHLYVRTYINIVIELINFINFPGLAGFTCILFIQFHFISFLSILGVIRNMPKEVSDLISCDTSHTHACNIHHWLHLLQQSKIQDSYCIP